MAEQEEEIRVAIEPEQADAGAATIEKVEPQPQKNGHDTAAEVEPKDDLRKQFEELQTTSQRDRDAAAAADRRARDAEQAALRAQQEVTAARSDVLESEATAVESGISAAETEASAAEAEFAAAFERGDAAASAAAQRKIARAEARIERLQEAKADLAARKKAPAEERREPVQRAPAEDPIEAYVANRSEPTAKWLRAHPEFITDERKNAKLTGAHFDAVGEGLQPDTPEYFEHVEKVIGLKQAPAAPAAPAKRRAAAPAAPVGQSGGAVNGGGREVVLTRGEAQAAQDGTHVWNYDDPSPQKRFKKGDAIGVQEFARRKLELTKQGAYDRTYTEQ